MRRRGTLPCRVCVCQSVRVRACTCVSVRACACACACTHARAYTRGPTWLLFSPCASRDLASLSAPCAIAALCARRCCRCCFYASSSLSLFVRFLLFVHVLLFVPFPLSLSLCFRVRSAHRTLASVRVHANPSALQSNAAMFVIWHGVAAKEEAPRSRQAASCEDPADRAGPVGTGMHGMRVLDCAYREHTEEHNNYSSSDRKVTQPAQARASKASPTRLLRHHHTQTHGHVLALRSGPRVRAHVTAAGETT